MSLLTRIIINAAGFLTAIALVPNIHTVSQARGDIFAIALIGGVVNTVLTPIFKFLTFPMILLTLGLWLWIANMIMFWMAGVIGNKFGFGFTVTGFWPVFWGALVVSIVSRVFGFLLLKR